LSFTYQLQSEKGSALTFAAAAGTALLLLLHTARAYLSDLTAHLRNSAAIFTLTSSARYALKQTALPRRLY
jgi:hypothetical protein